MTLNEELEAAYLIRDLRIREIEVARIEKAIRERNRTSHVAAQPRRPAGRDLPKDLQL